MKKLKNFLKVFIFVQLGACAGRILARYIDYRQHPGIYAMQSAPWYTRIFVTLGFTAVVVGLTTAAYFFVNHRIKRSEEKSKKNEA